MNEKFPPQENNKNPEIEALLKTYPLPEKFEDKKELALKLKKVITTLLNKDCQKYHKKMHDFGLNLRNKYKNASQYYLYNVFIGSSYDKIVSEFDFPENDSIQKFLEIQELSSRLDD
ncbi:MAG: hypothetical protein ACYC3G_02870 [Minisyncoccota bacterium]